MEYDIITTHIKMLNSELLKMYDKAHRYSEQGKENALKGQMRAIQKHEFAIEQLMIVLKKVTKTI